MNEEVITISSSNSPVLSLNGQHDKDRDSPLRTLSSSSGYTRMAVRWENGKTYTRRRKSSVNETPSGEQKVDRWMREIDKTASNNAFPLLEDMNNVVYGAFTKSPSYASSSSFDSSVNFTNVKLESRSQSIEQTPQTNKRSLRSKSTDVNVRRNTPKNTKRLLLTPIKCEVVEKKGEPLNSKYSDVKSEAGSDLYDVPQSPESRKKELYQYLKLMNPADKKEILSIQNRRSTRVKNLNILQERKELEKKLKGKYLNGISNGLSEVPLQDLNFALETPTNNNQDDDSQSFTFPAPVLSIIKEEPFERSISKFLYNIKRSYGDALKPLRKRLFDIMKMREKHMLRMEIHKEKEKKDRVKSLRIHKLKLTKIANKKIINQHIENSKKIKKRPKGNSGNKVKSLRSAGKLKNVAMKKLMLRNTKELIKKKKIKSMEDLKENEIQSTTVPKLPSPRVDIPKKTESTCEILSIKACSEEENVDLENYIDDMIEFKHLTEEHRRCLIESRILSTKPTIKNSILNSPTISQSTLTDLNPFISFSPKENKTVNSSNKSLNNTIPKLSPKEPVGITESKTEQFDCQVTPKADTKLEQKEEKEVQVKTDKSDVNKTPEMKQENQTKVKKEELTESDEIKNDFVDIIENGIHEGVEEENDQKHDDHDYANIGSSSDSDEEDEDQVIIARTVPRMTQDLVTPQRITNVTYEPFTRHSDPTSLHRSLAQPPERKTTSNGFDLENSSPHGWDTFHGQQEKSGKKKNTSHSIYITDENGAVLNAFYIDGHLIVIQEYVVSIWTQSALGHVLAAQNMWIPNGHVSRIVLDKKCIQKKSMEMVFSMENTVAYIELWTKEHKSEIRQGPVADVFATVYFWKHRQNGIEKKVLQIENINGFAEDVQYVVLKNVPIIIVSWHSVSNDKVTNIHKYRLAPDFATTTNIEMEPVNHYVSSLHNIEDCDNMVMGCGENKITLWNIDYGYIVSTIELNDIRSPLATLWVKCEKGFLFTIQQCVDRELRLIVINGLNHSWKKLQSYVPPDGYDRLKGVCIDNGNLLSFYDSGILCWNALSGEPVVEVSIDNPTGNIPSDKHLIQIIDEQVFVRHGLSYLLDF